MDCTLNPQTRNILIQVVAKDMMNLAENGKKLDLQVYMKSIYDLIAPSKGELTALIYTANVANILSEIRPFDTGIKQLFRDSNISLDKLDQLEVLFSDAETVADEVKKFIGPSQEAKKKLKAFTDAKRNEKKKKKAEQAELDFTRAGFFYKKGAKITVLRGKSKGLTFQVVSDNGKTVTITNGKIVKTLSKKSVQPGVNTPVMLSPLALGLKMQKEELEREEASEFRNEATIQVIKEGIAELEAMIEFGSTTPVLPKVEKAPVKKKAGWSKDDIFEAQNNERQRSVDQWYQNKKAEMAEEELVLSTGTEDQPAYTEEELEGIAYEAQRIASEIATAEMTGDPELKAKKEKLAELEAILKNFSTIDNNGAPVQSTTAPVPVPPTTGTVQTVVKPEPPAINKIEPQVRINAVQESKGKVFNAHAPTLLATTGREAPYTEPGEKKVEGERVPYEDTAPLYKIQRNILNKLGKTGNNTGADITLGNYEGIYLTAMHMDNPKLDAISIERDPQRAGVFLVVTDRNGNPLRFDSNSGTVANEGIQAVYPLQATKSIINADGSINMDNRSLTTAAEALQRAHGDKANLEKYKQIILKEARAINDIRKHVQSNTKGSSIRLNITGGSMGYIKTSFQTRTNLSAIDTKDLVPFVEKGMGKIGYANDSVDGLHGSKLELEKPTVKQSGYAETIKSLLFDNLVDEFNQPLDYEYRRQLIRTFIPVGTDFVKFWRNTDENTGAVTDTGKYGEYNLIIGSVDDTQPIVLQSAEDFANPEKMAAAKAMFDRLVNEVRQADINPKYKTQYNQFKLHASIEEIRRGNIEFPIINGNTFTTQVRPYKDILIEANFQVNTNEIGEDKKLRRTNSYFMFGVDPELFIEESVEEAEAITPESIVTEKINDETTVKELEDIMEDELEIEDDVDFDMNQSLEDIKNAKKDGLNTSLDVKSKSIEATKKQIEEAEEWFNTHPLAKHIRFKGLFDVINNEAVATWTADGITLYQGSDYSDLYHEAFHGFSQMFLTKKQKKELYNEVRKKEGTFKDYERKYTTFKTATDKQIEEYLAESFREYMLKKGKKTTKGSPKQNSFFRRIFNALKALFQGTTARDLAINSEADAVIRELFEKLRLGNISEYSYDVRNAQFGTLNSGIISEKTEGLKPNELTALNYQNSKTITDMVDFYLSDYVNALNSGLDQDGIKRKEELRGLLENKTLDVEERLKLEGEYKALKAKATHQWTGEITKNRKVQEGAYGFAKSSINALKNKKGREYNAETDPTKKVRLRNDYYMLKFAVDNFGTVKDIDLNKAEEGQNVTNVIAYHQLKSKVFETEFTIDNEDTSADESFLKATNGFVRNGNENSLKELAKSEIIYLLKTLPKFTRNKDGKWEGSTNRFGIPEMNDYQATWNRLARALENSQNFDVMFSRLQGIAQKYPPVQEIINRLGNPYQNMTSRNEHGIWTNFWQTFNKARVPLIQLTVTEKRDQTTEELFYKAKVGEVFNADTAIYRRWQNTLQESFPDPSNNILKDKEGNYLNTEAILQDYPTAAHAIADPFGFYSAIGFQFTDTEEIYEALSNPELFERFTPEFFHTNLFKLNESGDKVRDLKLFTKGQETRFKALLALEASYSDTSSNFMVSNAKGNTQFEHTLNNSMTMMVSAMNTANTYQELIAMPQMGHLDVDNSPFAKASIWMKSLFDMDPASDTYGQRKKYRGQPVTLKLANLSGVLFQELKQKEDGTEHNESGTGVDSASADEYSKLILDLHLHHANVPELMRHADKGTSFTMSIDGALDGNKNALDSYIPMSAFSGNRYKGLAYQKLVPHIVAEIIRSNRLIRYEKEGIKNYSHSYIKKITDPVNGRKFYAFDNVLRLETQNDLWSKVEGLENEAEIMDVINNMDNGVKEKLYTDINDYFNEQYNEVNEKFTEAEFIGENIKSDVKKHGIPESLVKESLLKSYVYNSWIHNIESLSVIYGDIAQFDEIKEGFHKRNAGAGSTGTILRTDKLMQDFINNNLWEGSYAHVLGYTQHQFTGRVKTGIVEDMSVDSVYTPEYAKVVKNSKEYNGQNEADAQGLITFDAYRQFKTAEGTWSDSHEALYNAIIAGKDVDGNKVSKFFPVIKGQYWGPLATEKGLLPVTAMHKYSLFPLIPTVIKGKQAEAVHKKMLQEGVSYVTFESGSKVGIMTKDKDSGFDKLYSNQKTRTLDPGIADQNNEVTAYDPNNPYFTPNIIHLEFFKNQLEIHDERKGKVIFSTQLRKLIEDGLVKNGVPTDYMPDGTKEARIESWDSLDEKNKEKVSNYYRLLKVYESNIAALTEHAKNSLLDEINWTSEVREDGSIELSGSMENLMNLVKKELSRQDLGDHGINYIQIASDGTLKHDLSGSFQVEKLEKVLNALMVKKLVKQKVNGEGLIQVANTLFEDIASKDGRNYENPTAADIKKWGSNDLPTYTQNFDENGKPTYTSAMKVKVSLSGDFRNLILLKHKDGKKIKARTERETLRRLNEMIKDEEWLDMGENRRMITMTGVRIPVQGMNSMEFMEVYEFLPAEAGSVIIPPSEIVTKSGADFDVDKMTVMMPNIAVVNGKAEIIKQRDTDGLDKETLTIELETLREARDKAREKWDKVFTEKDKTAEFAFTEEQTEELEKLNTTIKERTDEIKEVKEDKKTLYKRFGGENLKKEVKKYTAKLDKLYEQKEAAYQARKELVKQFGAATFAKVVEEQTAEMKELNDEIAYTQRDLNSLSAKGIENDLISNVAEILSLPINFESLITPNSTALLDDSAEQMAEFATDYDHKKTTYANEGPRKKMAKGKMKPVMSATRALEVGYNLYKHSVNSVGKEVLGIGAVDNTYNTLFNRIGAYMNPSTVPLKDFNAAEAVAEKDRTAEQKDIISRFQKQTILLPHNTRKVDGQDAIDLSDLLTKDGDKIADLVNQMINGWVDIAADAWIFNIQGNKEVGPTLLFLAQAGVPIKQAIHFVSNPMIREYVKEQKLAKSTFAKVLGKGSGNPNFAKNDAVRAILQDERFGFNVLDKDIKGKQLKAYLTKGFKQIAGSPQFDAKVLENKATTTVDRAYDNIDRRIFMHFLEIEEMTGAVRDVKMRTNVDTSRDASLFAASDRLDMLEGIKQDTRLPSDLVPKIQGKLEGYNTPISSFFIQEFQIELLGDAFPLRNHTVLNKFIRNNLDKGTIDATYGNKDAAVVNLKSDLVNFIFQNELRYFNIDKLDTYLNHPVKEFKAKDAMISQGVAVKDGVIYIDKRNLKAQYDTAEFGTNAYLNNYFFAKTSANAFSNEQEYYHFAIMREVIRSQNPIESLVDSAKFTFKLNQISETLNQKEGESNDTYIRRMVKTTYELYLRDEALHKTFNHYGLFQSNATFAHEFVRIRETYQPLVDEFPGLFNRLNLSKGALDYKNLALTSSALEGDDINIMAENLMKLQKKGEVSMLLPKATAKEIQEITEFFNNMEIYAFLQSGLNMKSSFALNQFVPQVREDGKAGKVLQIMDEPIKKIVKEFNDDSLAASYYMDVFYNDWQTENNEGRRAIRIRGKNYTNNMSFTDPASIDPNEVMADKRTQKVLFQEQYKELYVSSSDNVGDTEQASEVNTVSSAYGVVTANNKPDAARTKATVDLITPQIAAQAYKENNSGTANDMFMYGLRWTRKSNAKEPLDNHSSANKGRSTFDALAKDGYVYDKVDQNGNPLAPVSDLQPIIDELESTLGLDMSDYDAVIGNIYLPGQKIATHRDTTESVSAKNYPVVVYTIGNDSGINIYENVDKNNTATGNASFASDRKTSIPTTNGSIYTFGMDGKGRFEMGHDTPAGIKRDKKFPPITLPSGQVVTNYTITLTFRRAGDLTANMPENPKTTPSQGKVTERSYDSSRVEKADAQILANNNENKIFMYNLATENTNDASTGDAIFHAAGPMVYGLPTIKSYRPTEAGDRTNIYRDTVKGETAVVNADVKNSIDEAINELVEKQSDGYQIIFSEQGYGTSMTQKDQQGNYYAPQTFLYLSQQLYENFGYVNPGYLTSPSGKNSMQSFLFGRGAQTVTDKLIQEERESEIKELNDEAVKEFMKHCITL